METARGEGGGTKAVVVGWLVGWLACWLGGEAGERALSDQAIALSAQRESADGWLEEHQR